jgi:hypothetical protein
MPFAQPALVPAPSPIMDRIVKILATRLLVSPMLNALCKMPFQCVDACPASNFCPFEEPALTSMSANLPLLHVAKGLFVKTPSDHSIANAQLDYREIPQEAVLHKAEL